MQDLKTAILRVIADQEGEATQEAVRHIAGEKTRTLFNSLREAGLIVSQKNPGSWRTYSLTDKGRKALELSDKPMGEMPTPRVHFGGTYVPSKPYIRPEGLRAFELPSDGRPRVAPRILASGVIAYPLGR